MTTTPLAPAAPTPAPLAPARTAVPAPEASLFEHLDWLPLRPASAASALGPTLLLAPHPDDESIGAGGLLALLADAGVPVRVLFVTDGTRSHPTSREYPAPRLRALREQEALDALDALGLAPEAAAFLRHPDCGLPALGTAAFREASGEIAAQINAFGAQTILVPWRRDPHCDHEGTWQLARGAIARTATQPRWLEYAVWARVKMGETAPRPDEADAWRLDITSVQERKRRAVAAHRSQTTRLITDDPEGFCLSPSDLAPFEKPWEVFIEPFDAT